MGAHGARSYPSKESEWLCGGLTVQSETECRNGVFKSAPRSEAKENQPPKDEQIYLVGGRQDQRLKCAFAS
jgi:hypothetical protein